MAADNIVQEQTTLRKPNSLYKLARQQALDEYKTATKKTECSDEDLPYEAWQAYLDNLRADTDEAFKDVGPSLQEMLSNSQADNFWQKWSSTFEEAIMKRVEVCPSDAKRCR